MSCSEMNYISRHFIVHLHSSNEIKVLEAAASWIDKRIRKYKDNRMAVEGIRIDK